MTRVIEGIVETIYYQDEVYTRLSDGTWLLHNENAQTTLENMGKSGYSVVTDHTELEKLYQEFINEQTISDTITTTIKRVDYRAGYSQ